MPNLVTPPAGSPLNAEQIAAAEARIAAQLGVPSLEREENVSESGVVGSSGLIALLKPAVSVRAVTLSGAPAMGILRTPWVLDVSMLTRPGYGGTWGTNLLPVPYTVTYTAGWTAEDLPPALRQAILLTAQYGAAPVGLAAETMGPVSRTYVTPGVFSADVLELLRPWAPLRF